MLWLIERTFEKREDYNVMTNRKNFFNQTVKHDERTYDNIWKIINSHGDIYTGCLLDYPYFQRHYKMLAIDLGKLQELEADWKGLKKWKKPFLNFDKELCEYCKSILV